MQIILLSGGSGIRLWPLSNDARSKQFLKLLDVEGSQERESMVQRVMRQLRESGISADVTVATSYSQRDAVLSQLGEDVAIVTEPSRRNTFPAVCLACDYLSKEKKCAPEEVVVVIPCDPYTGLGYFEAISRMAQAIEADVAQLMVMGIHPTYPSAKYAYILPSRPEGADGVIPVRRFINKPDASTAESLISEGALWNGGVFAFRLGYLTSKANRYVDAPSFKEIFAHYDEFPDISFDREIAEKATDMAMVEFKGDWKDLGTWNTLTEELKLTEYGNVVTDGTSRNTHLFNELGIPMLCLGTENLVVAASPDGIIISEKSKSENVKAFARKLKSRPMQEERRWGTYKVIDFIEFPDGFSALTKQLTLNPGSHISYQRHNHRDEVWTFIDGEGEIVIDGKRSKVGRGITVAIPKTVLHTLRATTHLTFIEVQSGSPLIEEDIERFDYDWGD